jgi:nitrile hydratase
MDGVHDLGGVKERFGPIVREEHEPVFHAPWEGRVYGMRQSVGPIFRLGTHRAAIERLGKERYLESSYYEKWLSAFITCLIDQGTISEAELNAQVAKFEANPELPATEVVDNAKALATMNRIFRKRIVRVPVENETPLFKVGDAVLVRDLHPAGHIRLPGYLRGKTGIIERYNGYYDIHDHERHDEPQPPPLPLYSVSFDMADLWGEGAEHGRIVADLAEHYIGPAEG